MQLSRRLPFLMVLVIGLSMAFTPAGNAVPVWPSANDTIPRPVGYVNDFEGLFTDSQKVYLDSLIAGFDRQTTIQIAVVTIDSNLTRTTNFDNFTLKMMNAWGVGQKGKNNGILIGISGAYHKIRIQNGYGIEKILSNIETKNIIDTEFIPYFRKSEYFKGTLNGLRALMERLQ